MCRHGYCVKIMHKTLGFQNVLVQEKHLQLHDNQYTHFSSEVVKTLCKQCMNGQEAALTGCSSVTEDFNCLILFVVKLFIKRLQSTLVTQILIVFLFKCI